MLATAAQLPAAPHGWVAEAKLDGARAAARGVRGERRSCFPAREITYRPQKPNVAAHGNGRGGWLRRVANSEPRSGATKRQEANIGNSSRIWSD